MSQSAKTPLPQKAGVAPKGLPLTRRQIYENAIRARSIRLAAISTLIAVVALYVIVPMAPGWALVKRSFFNWEILQTTFPKLASAFLVDLALFVFCAPVILILALLVALARGVTSPALFPLRLVAIFFTDVLRSVPIVLTIYLVGFGIPGLGLPKPWNSPYLWGSVALILTYSAYMAEVYRSGIESIHASQVSAARSLGLSQGSTLRYVILPQALRRVGPALMNFLISLQKDVALLSFIGPIEVLRQANVFKALYANFTPYVGAAILFLCITILATRLTDHLIAQQNAQRS